MTDEFIHNGNLILRKRFGCAHCDEIFLTREYAEKHLENEHEDLLP